MTVAPADATRACAWCQGPIPERARRDSKFCGKRCRQSSHRFGIHATPHSAPGAPMRFCYADPPYPGKAGYYPENTEVDHDELVAWLVGEFPDGWALSTSASALPSVLAACPPDVRVAAWVRQVRPTRSRRALSAWEPVILRGGRPLDTRVVQDLHDALVYRGRFRAFPGALVGMKPPPFSEWVFRMFGAQPGDQLVDLFPGSGAVTEAWRRFTGVAQDRRDATRPLGPGDASLLEARHVARRTSDA